MSDIDLVVEDSPLWPDPDFSTMRNLTCINYSQSDFRDSELPLTASAWVPSRDSLIFAFGPSKSNARLYIAHQAVLDRNNCYSGGDWDLASLPKSHDGVDKIINLHYHDRQECCFFVFAGGAIIRVEDKRDPDSFDLVGSLDAEVTAAAWSPDGSLLAITTCAKTVVLLSESCDQVASLSFSSDDEKLSKHVSVGWGKSETQFKGKGAKALRDPTLPNEVVRGEISPNDQKGTVISWRGDSSLLAINAFEEGQRRMIRVYSREGVLDSVSEPVDGLEGALSWRPEGKFICGIQRLDQSAHVVFFERNGLRHGGFPLRMTSNGLSTWARVIFLSWNNDSTVLAILFTDRVQLWTMGNHHYYLKQELPFPNSKHPSCDSVLPLSIKWHPTDPMRAMFPESYEDESALDMVDHSIDPSGGFISNISLVRLAFDVCSGPTSPPHDFGFTMVIDGCMFLPTLHDVELFLTLSMQPNCSSPSSD